MYQQYSYEEVLSAAERFAWRVEDLIGGERRLDFAKPFLPDSLARTEGMVWLTPEQRRVANQIRGAGYLGMFGLVEEFVLPFVLDHVRPQLNQDDYRVRAFLSFAAEEAKHIQLFRKFREEFDGGFGTACDMIGPPDAIGRKVLSHHPQCKSLLRHHWMEEVRHAKLDTLMVEAIAAECSVKEREEAVQGYLEIGAFLDGGLAQQAEFDAESFTK